MSKTPEFRNSRIISFFRELNNFIIKNEKKIINFVATFTFIFTSLALIYSYYFRPNESIDNNYSTLQNVEYQNRIRQLERDKLSAVRSLEELIRSIKKLDTITHSKSIENYELKKNKT